MAEILVSFDVSVWVSVRSGPVMLTAPKAIRTSNFLYSDLPEMNRTRRCYIHLGYIAACGAMQQTWNFFSCCRLLRGVKQYCWWGWSLSAAPEAARRCLRDICQSRDTWWWLISDDRRRCAWRLKTNDVCSTEVFRLIFFGEHANAGGPSPSLHLIFRSPFTLPFLSPSP